MNRNYFWVIGLLAWIAVYQTHAMDGSKTQLETLFEQRKKLQQEKWKLQCEIESINWQLWWYDLQWTFKNPRMHLWLHQGYYIRCAVTAIASITVGTIAYRIYSNKNKKGEHDEEMLDDDNEGNTAKQSKITVGRDPYL